jgi:hypothetical protein
VEYFCGKDWTDFWRFARPVVLSSRGSRSRLHARQIAIAI